MFTDHLLRRIKEYYNSVWKLIFIARYTTNSLSRKIQANFFLETSSSQRRLRIRRCNWQFGPTVLFDAPHRVSHVAASRKRTREDHSIRGGRRISRLQVHAHWLRRRLIRWRVISGNQPDVTLDGQGRTRARGAWPIAMCHLYNPKVIVSIARSIYKPQHICICNRSREYSWQCAKRPIE